MSPTILRTAEDMSAWRKSQNSSAKRIGFVPTMGALHKGHESLLCKSKELNAVSVLSIFVNPTQFNDSSDFEKYPVTWESDLKLAEKNDVDVIFAPTFPSLYPDQYKYKIIESELSLDLCGRNRPGHFDGVLTVVMKLLNLVRPHQAFFGEKDFQQLELVRGMSRAFFLDCEIVGLPTLREADGLAMSSRNTRLNPSERERAALISQIISQTSTSEEAAQLLTAQNFKVDYVKDIGNRRFVAATLGSVRLIDNVRI